MKNWQVRMYWEHLLPEHFDYSVTPPIPKFENPYHDEWMETVLLPKMNEYMTYDLIESTQHNHNYDERYVYRNFADAGSAQDWVDYFEQQILAFRAKHPEMDSWRYNLLRSEIVEV